MDKFWKPTSQFTDKGWILTIPKTDKQFLLLHWLAYEGDWYFYTFVDHEEKSKIQTTMITKFPPNLTEEEAKRMAIECLSNNLRNKLEEGLCPK